MDIKYAINKLVNGESLTIEETKEVTRNLFGRKVTQAQIGSILTALRMKGESVDEIMGCASVVHEAADKLEIADEDYIDIVGTGDGLGTFNISTAAAFVAAGAGVKVAKNSNRASGSIDVLEDLNVNVMLDPPRVLKCFQESGMGFMFAQIFYKKMKGVSKARKDLDMRTIFDIIAPLSNPSSAKLQLIGVFSSELILPFVKAMKAMGVKRGLVVSGDDGMDEITLTGETTVAEIKYDEFYQYKIYPEQFGLKRASIEDLKGDTIKENSKIILDILNGVEKGPKRDIVLFNAGAAIYVAGLSANIAEGIALARGSIDSGSALAKLNQVIKVSYKL